MLLNGANAAEVRNARVSANFLRTFGLKPALGRDFQEAEELPTGPKTVLLTDHLWREHLLITVRCRFIREHAANRVPAHNLQSPNLPKSESFADRILVTASTKIFSTLSLLN